MPDSEQFQDKRKVEAFVDSILDRLESLRKRISTLESSESAAGVSGATNLDELSDVTISGAAQGDVLTRGASEWINQAIGTNEVVVRLASGNTDGLAMGASTILARLASGNIVAATAAQIKTLLAIAISDVSGLVTALSGKASTSLNDLSSVAINASLVSDTDATDNLGSAAITWLKGWVKTLVAATAVAGSDASGGSLAIESTTHATKGNITFNGSLAKIDSVGEVYGRGDTEYGLVQFLVNLGTLPDSLFLTDYAPLTDFAGAPFETGNYNFNTPSVLQMYGTAVDKRQFLYKTVSISTAQNNAANCIVSAGVNVSLAGLRVDDGTDDNYLEFGMRTTGLAFGALSFYTRVRTGGGAVTETQVGKAELPAVIPYVVRIFSFSGTNFCYIKSYATGWTFMAVESYGYTITRRGIVVTANSSDTPNGDRAGNFNSIEEE